MMKGSSRVYTIGERQGMLTSYIIGESESMLIFYGPSNLRPTKKTRGDMSSH
ncbi:MAG TPA: hypothetical protein VE130_16330 [Nitrososphaeraceae archaeon]|jgi:hypothetical protein|nr:hypothetical protein [Nitrososphaeraceae archaeon]